MVPDIEQHLPRIESLCLEFGVRRLELFGSATRDDLFDPGSSDVDFLVEFGPHPTMLAHKQYFYFLAALEDLLHRRVDLVDAPAMRNKYFIEHVNQTKELLYAA